MTRQGIFFKAAALLVLAAMAGCAFCPHHSRPANSYERQQQEASRALNQLDKE